MRSIFPRLVVVLSLFVFGLSAQAQSSSGALPDSQVTVPNPLANAGGSELQSLPDLIRRVKPSVVSILTYDAKDEPLISGTGFFVRPGEVVTNVHVIKGAQRVEIHTLDEKGRTYPVAGALAIDEEADLALLSVNLPEEKSRPLPLSTALPEEGEPIFLIGNPLRLEGSISNGIVSAIREVPALGPHIVGDQGIYEVAPDGRIVWERKAGDRRDEFGFTAEGFDYRRRTVARQPDNIWGYLEINRAKTLGPNHWHRDDPGTVFHPDNILGSGGLRKPHAL